MNLNKRVCSECKKPIEENEEVVTIFGLISHKICDEKVMLKIDKRIKYGRHIEVEEI